MKAANTPNDVFSAIDPSLGYLYQIRYSLYRLLEANEEEEISIEWVDDVAVENDGSINEQLQLKHHLRGKASLTDSSPDLWKTIRVWSEGVKTGSINPSTTRLLLITTAAAPAGSIASLLKDTQTGRDAKTALQRLMDVASTSGNVALKDSFDAFKSLPSTKKRLLVDSIIVVDNMPMITDLEKGIKKKLDLSVRKEHMDLFYERLEGWWFDKIIRHFIEPNKTSIKRFELQSKIRDIAEQFEEDALPIDFLDAEPPETPDAANDDRLFVVQLRIIALNNKLIEKAIRDYYKAFEQRSRWAREHLIDDKDLEVYENRLVDEWQRFFYSAVETEGDKVVNEAEYLKTGREIFRWMNTIAQFPIRPKVVEPYVMRGSYHMLADQFPPRVGWHPRFLDRLQDVLPLQKEQ
ncbi:MAG: ABC-three component system protein [Bacteroidota bacterium]|jgi:hypothetical protein